MPFPSPQNESKPKNSLLVRRKSYRNKKEKIIELRAEINDSQEQLNQGQAVRQTLEKENKELRSQIQNLQLRRRQDSGYQEDDETDSEIKNLEAIIDDLNEKLAQAKKDLENELRIRNNEYMHGVDEAANLVIKEKQAIENREAEKREQLDKELKVEKEKASLLQNKVQALRAEKKDLQDQLNNRPVSHPNKQSKG